MDVTDNAEGYTISDVARPIFPDGGNEKTETADGAGGVVIEGIIINACEGCDGVASGSRMVSAFMNAQIMFLKAR